MIAAPEAVQMVRDFAEQMRGQVDAGLEFMSAGFKTEGDAGPLRLIVTEDASTVVPPGCKAMPLEDWLREQDA